jgi:peptidoglycan hydrolase-like protein with peptidoglycan-binding domain
MTVEQKQNLLAFLGFYKAKVDGNWGPASCKAMTEFQRSVGISATGEADETTCAALLKAVASWEPEIPETGNTGTFWDEIEFFTRDEFKCKCCGKYCNGHPAEPDERMVRIANQLRKNLGVPITVVSGLRCKTWNAIQGGVSNSQHMYGEAADIYAKGVSQSRVEAELDKIGGVRYHYPIKGSNNVHFDVPKGNR